ncbi:MAG: universal stress protein [Aeoliella sp.]
MSPFQNILVGVDLSQGDWLAADEGESSSQSACEQAIQLSKATGAKLHFLATLDLDERTKRLIEESGSEEDTVVGMAKKALRRFTEQASKAGVSATSNVVLGRSRSELAERAKSAEHDLVMVGTRDHGVLSGLLLGSTSLELLRTSPCPLWVAKPSASPTPKRILVATNFSPVCHALVNVGAELAQKFDSELHVVHVVSTHRKRFLQFSSVPPDEVEAEHREQLAAGRQQLDELADRPAVAVLDPPPTLHLLEGRTSQVIQEQVTNLGIDLLLMGTVAWSGVPGMLLGSTAQNLLPQLTCSLLTMRPDEL